MSRTLEYAILTLIIVVLTLWFAGAVAKSIQTSINHSAECISSPETCRG